jgi:hypothetical protein
VLQPTLRPPGDVRPADGAVGSPAQLWVARGNPRAARFYERNGFVPDGATDDGSFGGIAALRLVR